MSNTVTVGFSNNGTSAHYVMENNSLAGQMGIANILGSSYISENITGGAISGPYSVPANTVTIPGGDVTGEYTTTSSVDEAYRFVADGWNTVKNISVTAQGDDSVLFIADNFVHADMDFSGITNTVELRIFDGKRGNYSTGSGDDRIEITTATNNEGWSNLHIIETGAGDDIVSISKGDDAMIDTTIVNYTDGRFTTVEADLGDGNDVYFSDEGVATTDIIHGGKGNDTLFTGLGDDILYGGEDRGAIAKIQDGMYNLLADGDRLFGGEGSDTFSYTTGDGFGMIGDGFDHILDFEDNDLVELLTHVGDTVETEVATVQTDSGDVTGTMITVNDTAAIFLENYFNDAEIFV